MTGLACRVLAVALLGTGLVAQMGWTPVRWHEPQRRTTPWWAPAIAADVGRERIVSFGVDHFPTTFADTWEYAAGVWSPRDAARVPPVRQRGILVHDSVRGRTVLFGGVLGSRMFADTWEWDGDEWTQRVTTNAPAGRFEMAAAFDELRGEVVLHGGTNLIAFGDTWVYDGVDWQQRTASQGPPPRTGHRMAFDAARGNCVVFGGGNASNQDTWLWDGVRWQQLSTAVAPSSRTSHLLVYDRNRQRVVLAAGSYGSAFSDTWEWDGLQWTQRATTMPFSQRINPAAVTDPTAGSAMVIDGGEWRWDGSAWTGVPAPFAMPRCDRQVYGCADPIRNRVIVFGGTPVGSSSTATRDTFEWDGARWEQRSIIGPRHSGVAGMAFDDTRGVAVLLHGNPTVRTWEWNGNFWAARASGGPSGRTVAAMTYDSARQEVVLFGGEYYDPQQGPIYLNDTWTYDGTTWTSRSVSGPSHRSSAAFAYDPVRQVSVLFGGDSSGAVGDTFEWDGTSWTARNPATAPAARLGAAMAWDPSTGTLALVGGAGSYVAMVYDDSWRWDGTNWTQVAVGNSLFGRYGHLLAFDPVRQQLMVHGGRHCPPNATSNLQCGYRFDTWHLGDHTAPTSSQVGAPCASGTPPRLGGELPWLGNAAFGVELRDAAPGLAALIGLSFASQPQPLGPCTLWLQAPVVTTFALTNPYGVARAAIPIPFDPGLAGVTLFTQGAVLTGAGPLQGIDVTAARQLVIGN